MRVTDLPHLTIRNCEKMLGNKSWRKIANNTELRKDTLDSGAMCFVVKLHNTDIMTLHAQGPSAGDIELNTGGWNTVTTISRFKAMLAPGIIRWASYAGNECTIARHTGEETTGDRQTISHWEYNQA